MLMYDSMECRPNLTMFISVSIEYAFITLILLGLIVATLITDNNFGILGFPPLRIILVIGLLTWILRLIVAMHTSPSFVVTSEGIDLKLIYRRRLIRWEEIQRVSVSPFRTYIIVPNLSIFNYIGGVLVFRFESIVFFSNTRINYSSAMDIIRDQLGDKVEQTLL